MQRMPIELKCSIFTLGLWLQIPHHVEASQVIYTKSQHLKLKVIILLWWVHIHCIQINNSDNDTFLNKKTT